MLAEQFATSLWNEGCERVGVGRSCWKVCGRRVGSQLQSVAHEKASWRKFTARRCSFKNHVSSCGVLVSFQFWFSAGSWHFELRVQAADFDGPGSVRVSRTGKILESRRLPFSLILPLRRAHVDDVKVLKRRELCIRRGSMDRGLKNSLWANQHIVSVYGWERCPELHGREITEDSQHRRRVHELNGSRLLCHCTPGQTCHGDNLVQSYKQVFAQADGRADTTRTLATDGRTEQFVFQTRRVANFSSPRFVLSARKFAPASVYSCEHRGITVPGPIRTPTANSPISIPESPAARSKSIGSSLRSSAVVSTVWQPLTHVESPHELARRT